MSITIPRLENTVGITSNPTPRAAGLGPEAFGSGLATGMAALGKDVETVALKEKADADTGMVLGSMKQLDDLEISKVKEVHSMVGESALGSADVHLQDYNNGTSAIRDGLKNDTQRIAFDTMVQKRRASFTTSVTKYEIEQTRNANVGNAKAAVDSAQNRTSLYFEDPAKFEEARKDLENRTLVLAKLQGFEPGSEAAKASIFAVNSTVYEDQIKARILKNPSEAKGLFDANRDKLSKDAVDRLDQHIESTVSAQEGDNGALELWSQFGPAATLANDTKGAYKGNVNLVNIDMSVLQAKVDEKFKNEPAKKNAALSKLHALVQAHDYTAGKERDHNTDVIYSAYEKGGLGSANDIKKLPEFQRLDGKDQASFTNMVESEQRQLEAIQRGKVSEWKRDKQEARLEFMGSMTPEILMETSEAEIRAMVPALGIAGVNNLITQKRGYHKSEESLGQAKADDGMVREEAVNAGLDYAFAPTGPKQKKVMGQLKEAVEQAIVTEQRLSKTPITPERQKDIIREQLRKVTARKPGTMYGVKTGEEFQFQTSPQNFDIPGASDGDILAVTSVLKSRGVLRPSYDQIAEGVRRLKRGR